MQTMEAFAAAATYLSFTKAGVELNLSQSAVSRQVKQLEDRIGVPLFLRRHKVLELTKAGQILLEGVGRSIDELRRSIDAIHSILSPTITISASTAIASFWLLPGIAEFKAAYPEMRVRVIAADEHGYSGLLNGETDFAIIYDQLPSYGFEGTELFDELIFPACSPLYLHPRTIAAAADLMSETLIDFEIKHLRTVRGWSDWFRQMGMPIGEARYSLMVSNYDLASRAAQAGQGITLMWSYVAPLQEFRAGRLIRPIDVFVRTGHKEYLIHAPLLQKSSAHEVFRNWLVAYAQKTREDIDAFFSEADA
ncbi:LysR family transcriptional regulator [Pseudomonas sp. YeP6b]|nr:LysR family transcriptional regulator [Pseudomonas sp. YeP6b]